MARVWFAPSRGPLPFRRYRSRGPSPRRPRSCEGRRDPGKFWALLFPLWRPVSRDPSASYTANATSRIMEERRTLQGAPAAGVIRGWYEHLRTYGPGTIDLDLDAVAED